MKAEFSMTGAIGRLGFSHPPHNTLVDPVFLDAAFLDRCMGESALKGIILVGEGRHFSGGADREALDDAINDPLTGPDALARRLDEGKQILERISLAPVPIVAAIRGQCLGAGLEIALACHFRVATPGAMFGFPESTLGLLPGMAARCPFTRAFARPHSSSSF